MTFPLCDFVLSVVKGFDLPLTKVKSLNYRGHGVTQRKSRRNESPKSSPTNLGLVMFLRDVRAPSSPSFIHPIQVIDWAGALSHGDAVGDGCAYVGLR